jgi:filamentous hemagglutinin
MNPPRFLSLLSVLLLTLCTSLAAPIQASLVGSLEGDVHIESGKDYRQTGSVVSAAEGGIGIEAANIAIAAGEESYVYGYEQELKQRGLTLALKAPVIEAAAGFVGAARDVGESRDARVNAMSAANAGMAGYSLYEGLQSLMAAQSVSEASQGVSISITYGEQENEQTKRLEQTFAAPSQVLAGGRIELKARGENPEESEEAAFPRGGNIAVMGSDLIGGQGILTFSLIKSFYIL